MRTIYHLVTSDTMDNMGAFITLNGKEMKPIFTTYEAVVSADSEFQSHNYVGNNKNIR